MINTAVIMCAGYGSRFYPESKVVPKEMLPAGREPIIAGIVRNLARIGVDDITIIISPGKEMIKTYMEEVSFPSMQGQSTIPHIEYIYQHTHRGTADCVKLVQDRMRGKPFFVLNGDEIIDSVDSYRGMIDCYTKYCAPCILLQDIDISCCNQFGMAEISGDRVLNITEKPQLSECHTHFAYIGLCILDDKIFPMIDKCISHSGEVYLTEALNYLAKSGNLYGVTAPSTRYDFGDIGKYYLENIRYLIDHDDMRDRMITGIKNLINKYD